MPAPPFDRLVWHEDRVVLSGSEDLIFWLGRKRRSMGGDADGFIFDKSRRLVDQYAAFWKDRGVPEQPNVLELGIHDGGSIAFWTELITPRRYVGVDIASWGDSPYFTTWVERPENQARVVTRWSTDQADQQALCRLVEDEFDGPLDLVIDDASHLREPTRASFEALFPLLRPGGLYIIEDWSWAHWPNLAKDFPLPRAEEPTPLIADIVSMAGDMAGYARAAPDAPLQVPTASVTVQPDVVIVERGHARLLDGFVLKPQVPFGRPADNRRGWPMFRVRRRR